MRIALPVVVSGLLTTQALAADLSVSVEIPKLTVAEYHRPYVAMWIERANQSVAANLAVWFDLKQKNNDGTKWLKDLRQWWRRSGRELAMPVDGLSGATRAAGSIRSRSGRHRGAARSCGRADEHLGAGLRPQSIQPRPGGKLVRSAR